MKNVILENKISAYLLTVLLLSCIPYFFILKAGTTESAWIQLLMWIPAISAIVLKLLTKEHLFKGMKWNIFRYFHWVVLAALLPFIIEIIAIFITIKLGYGAYKTDFLGYEDGLVKINGVAMIFGAAPQPILMFMGNFFLSFLLGNIFYMLAFTMGEEYGWRGYLQPLMTKKFEVIKGLIFLGLIWGYWHLPGILLGHNFPDYPVLGGLVIMPAVCVFLALALGIAYERTKLIWVPVMLHSSINLIGEFQGKAIVETIQSNIAFDIIWSSLWALIACVFILKMRKNIRVDTKEDISELILKEV